MKILGGWHKNGKIVKDDELEVGILILRETIYVKTYFIGIKVIFKALTFEACYRKGFT